MQNYLSDLSSQLREINRETYISNEETLIQIGLRLGTIREKIKQAQNALSLYRTELEQAEETESPKELISQFSDVIRFTYDFPETMSMIDIQCAIQDFHALVEIRNRNKKAMPC